MEKTVITWSAENWLTILLMVVVGFAALGLAGRLLYAAKAKIGD